MPQKPWHQLGFVLGEAALSLVSGGVVFIIISRVSGPEVLGTYALAVAWLTLSQGVSSFGIPEFLIREVGVHGRDAAGQVVHATMLGMGTATLGLCVMAVAVRLVGYSTLLVQVITVASVALIPVFLNTLCRSVFLALREMHLTFLAALAEATIMAFASLYLVLSGYDAFALMVALVVAKVTSASIAVALLYGRVLTVRPPLSFDFLMRTARTVFTFGIGSLLAILTMRINTIMASLWVDIAAVGQLAAATKIIEIGLMMPSLFVQLLMTRMANSFNVQANRDPNCFGAAYQNLFAMVVPACVGIWVFAGPTLEFLFGASFGNAFWILRVLLIYLAIEAVDSNMSVILIASYRQRKDVACLAFNPLINILLNLGLLPVLGTIGAVIGRVGGAVASATLRNIVIGRELTPVRWFRYALKPVLISIAVGSACYWFGDTRRPAWFVFYVAATAVLLIITHSFSFSAIKDLMSFPTSRDSDPQIGFGGSPGSTSR